MSQPRVHDLLRIRPDAARFAEGTDDWVLEALQTAPWVVTRRAAPLGRWILIGVRGDAREKRQAGSILIEDVVEVVTPEDLVSRRPARRHPAFEALAELSSDFDRSGAPWGPVGAAGFELATGLPALRDSSDLDIALRVDSVDALERLEPLRTAIQSAKARIDILIEMPIGGVSFAETDGGANRLMVRSPGGPKIMSWLELKASLAASRRPGVAHGVE